MTEIRAPRDASKGTSLSIVAIPLGSIIPNPEYQPRGLSDPSDNYLDDPDRWQDHLDPDHLESLRAGPQEAWPPLLVTSSESDPGVYDLVDGFHRYAVALERAQPEQPNDWHETTIACCVVAGGGVDTAIAANIRHGLPLSMADRKAAARLFHQWDPELSYRQIAAKVGLSDKTVKAALTLAPSAEYPQVTGEEPASEITTYPNPIQKLVKLAVAASRDRTGTDWLEKLFSHKSDQQQQVDYVARVIRTYPEQEQVAQNVAMMGQVLIAGAQRCLGEPDQQSARQERV